MGTLPSTPSAERPGDRRESGLAAWNKRKQAENRSGTLVVGLVGLLALIAGAMLVYFVTAGLFT